jgi:hypothetical protein
MEYGRVILSHIAHTRVDDVLLLCIGERDMLDAEVDPWLGRLSVQDYKALLISCRGAGSLTSKQRVRIGEFWKTRQAVPTALLTNSAVARHVGTAISWVSGVPLRGFEAHDHASALRYCGAQASVHEVRAVSDALHTAIEKKQRNVG